MMDLGVLFHASSFIVYHVDLISLPEFWEEIIINHKKTNHISPDNIHSKPQFSIHFIMDIAFPDLGLDS